MGKNNHAGGNRSRPYFNKEKKYHSGSEYGAASRQSGDGRPRDNDPLRPQTSDTRVSKPKPASKSRPKLEGAAMVDSASLEATITSGCVNKLSVSNSSKGGGPQNNFMVNTNNIFPGSLVVKCDNNAALAHAADQVRITAGTNTVFACVFPAVEEEDLMEIRSRQRRVKLELSGNMFSPAQGNDGEAPRPAFTRGSKPAPALPMLSHSRRAPVVSRNGPPTEVPTSGVIACANCGGDDHLTTKCVKAGAYGSVNGCPIHHDATHRIDDCPNFWALTTAGKVDLIIRKRECRPPLRTSMPGLWYIVALVAEKDGIELPEHFPWTLEYSRAYVDDPANKQHLELCSTDGQWTDLVPVDPATATWDKVKESVNKGAIRPPMGHEMSALMEAMSRRAPPPSNYRANPLEPQGQTRGRGRRGGRGGRGRGGQTRGSGPTGAQIPQQPPPKASLPAKMDLDEEMKDALMDGGETETWRRDDGDELGDDLLAGTRGHRTFK